MMTETDKVNLILGFLDQWTDRMLERDSEQRVTSFRLALHVLERELAEDSVSIATIEKWSGG